MSDQLETLAVRPIPDTEPDTCALCSKPATVMLLHGPDEKGRTAPLAYCWDCADLAESITDEDIPF